MTTNEKVLKALMLASLDGSAVSYRSLLERLSSRLRAYYKGKLDRFGRGAMGSCPLAWCSWRRVTAFAGKSRAGQLAIAGRLTVGSSLNGAMVSSVM